jgi:hypothetical protein
MELSRSEHNGKGKVAFPSPELNPVFSVVEPLEQSLLRLSYPGLTFRIWNKDINHQTVKFGYSWMGYINGLYNSFLEHRMQFSVIAALKTRHLKITITILDIIHRPVFYLKLSSTLYVCSYLTGNTLSLPYEPSRLMLSIGLWRCYINITITVLDIIHRPVFYLKLNSICLFVPHRKHITSPLRAQQVNAMYRFVTMVY